MKKIFAIYYNRDIDENGQLYPEETNRQFNEAVFDLSNKLTEKGIKFIMITRQNDYVGNGQFFGFWEPSSNRRFVCIRRLIAPGLIFDKGHIDFNDGLLNIFNNHSFARLGRNKYTQAVIAKDFVPRTQLVCNEGDYEKVLGTIKTDQIVLKPLDENGGRGVALYDRNDLKSNQVFPVIAQEFIETKSGIDGMVEGRHDIRLYIVDGAVVMCSIRQPKKGGWLSNTCQGGTIHFFNKSKISPELLEFARPIIEKFNKMGGKFYSVDFMHGDIGWRMVEMNDRPGMPALYQDTDGAIEKFYEKMTNMIVRDIS